MNWDKPICQYMSHKDSKQVTQEKVELLNWVIQLCGSGATTGMIRKIVHNKIVAISGEGEKA